MNISKELIEKAKTAKTAEELLEMAKAEGIELTAEQAEKAFDELNKTGEISDDELDNVAGGGCGSCSPSGMASSSDEVVFLYEIGQIVEMFNSGFGTTKRVRIIGKFVECRRGHYYPCYRVEYIPDGGETWTFQSQVEVR